MRARYFSLFLIVLMTAGLFAGCQKAETPPPAAPAVKAEPPKPAPPPPPPATSLGNLMKVEKAGETSLQAFCSPAGELHAKAGVEIFAIVEDNVCNSKDKAREGKVFLVLRFEGKAKRRGDGEVTAFRSVTRGGHLARMESRSWVEDGAGKKFKNGLLVVKKDFKQVAFEVPTEGAGWVWHDDKEVYRLEPYPVALMQPSQPAAPGKTVAAEE